MPDWTYQTVFRPVLRQLPFPVAQALVFRSMGLLGRTAAGRAVIRLMGHASPPAEATFQKNSVVYPGRCGLACGVDMSAQAVSAVSLFGFGLIETGPVYVCEHEKQLLPQWRKTGIAIPADGAPVSMHSLAAALRKNSCRGGVPVLVRLLLDSDTSESDLKVVAETFRDIADGFSIVLNDVEPVDSGDQLSAKLRTLKVNGARLFLVVNTQSPDSFPGPDVDVDGVILECGTDAHGARGSVGEEALAQAVSSVASVTMCDQERLLIVSGGVTEPGDAIRILRSGADMVLVDSGFAVSGPGLPKRINAAVKARQLYESDSPEDCDAVVPVAHRSWFWAFLLGLSLTIGGLVAFFVGLTRVVLPYDEEFLGMLRDEICSINSQLLPFMSHDRVTLAGTMLSLGPLYLTLAWFGDRRGMHWARVAFLSSAFVGFLSFFLFLGFGYFDPFHAFISAVLFQLTTLCLRSSQPACQVIEFDVRNSGAWRRAMWGQLLMVVHGAAILTAGIVISSFGVTSVFVTEDLEFMQTTRETLIASNARLVPLVAHDRASFGGILMATGITVMLTALWGWQRGRRWLWYALVGTGSAAYLTTIAIHWHVGYTSLVHLLPAYRGLGLLWLAMLLSAEWMFEDASQPEL